MSTQIWRNRSKESRMGLQRRKTGLPKRRAYPRPHRCTACLVRYFGKKCRCGTRYGTKRTSSRTLADTMWAKIVKAPGKCRRCGLVGPVDAAHIIGRAHLSVRHDPDNGIPLCRKDHRAFDAYQIDREAFITEVLGAERYAALRTRATEPWTRTYPIAELRAALAAAKGKT